MNSTQKAVTVLSILTVTWFSVSIYARGQERASMGEGGLFIRASELSEKPSQFWVLTNSSPTTSQIIVAINYPNNWFKIEDQRSYSDLVASRGVYAEFEGKCYFIEDVFVDPGIPSSILGGIIAMGFSILGLGWLYVGLKAWQLKKSSSN